MVENILLLMHSQQNVLLNEALIGLEYTYGNSSKWLKTLGLTLVPEKFHLCIFDSRPHVVDDWAIDVVDRRIFNSESMLYLRVKLDLKITWKDHIELLVSKADCL